MRGSLSAALFLLLAASSWAGAVDSDGDGVQDPNDCRPLDDTLWTVPSPALDLDITGGGAASLTWSAPASPGGTSVFYDLLLSGACGDWASCSCLVENTTALSAGESSTPPPGQILYYLVRTKNACGENLGEPSAGGPRTAGACAPFPKPDGEPCTVQEECNSGYCVDGRCCESACAGICERCDQTGLEGYCNPAPAGTDPDDECAAQDPNTCGTTGMCSGFSSCELHAAGTPCGDPYCGSSTFSYPDPYCDGNGTCTSGFFENCWPYHCDSGTGLCRTTCSDIAHCQPPNECNTTSGLCGAINGTSCLVGVECASGFCTDGYCCENACDGICESCDQAGRNGWCDPVPAGTDDEDECAYESPSSCGQDGTCSGQRTCRLWTAGTTCDAASCATATSSYPRDFCDGLGTCPDSPAVDCTPYNCDSGPGTCFAACSSDTACAPNFSCWLQGQECLLNDGMPCTEPTECANRFCCDSTCTNQLTDKNNCGGCGLVCEDIHSTNTCSGALCYPSCDTYWGNCDYDGWNGCETSLMSATDCGGCGISCPPYAHANAVCIPPAVCDMGTCHSGWADCDGSGANGCEIAYGAGLNLNTCETATYVGSKCGDIRRGVAPFCSDASWEQLTEFSGRGNVWYRAYAEECTACTGDIRARITLTPPAGSDFDLEAWGPCGYHIGTQSHTGSAVEQIILSVDDTIFDNSYSYYVRVVFVSGDPCAQWTLKFEGTNST